MLVAISQSAESRARLIDPSERVILLMDQARAQLPSGGLSAKDNVPLVVEIRGEISPSTALDLARIIPATLTDEARTPVLLMLSSNGGSFAAALQIVDALAEYGKIITIVDAGHNCNSACALIFLAGNIDGRPARIMHMDATVGLHQPYIPISRGAGSISSIGDWVSNEVELDLSYNRRHLFWKLSISRAFFDDFMRYPSDELRLINDKDAVRESIVFIR